ncbi:MAG: MBL fold metallo-hydrolase [Halothiobacillaceae bacterium]
MRFLMLILSLCSMPVLAGQTYIPQPEQVVDNVYAIIGPTDARTFENHGMNANYGFVVTESGVILVDSGPSRFSGPLIRDAVAQVTDQPIRWVINLGVQDHRWLGNDYFLEQGAEVIAFEQTVAAQKRFADQLMEGRLAEALGERLEGTVPAYADRALAGAETEITLGGEALVLSLTDAHFPGDAMLYLPRQDVVFTGDLVYVDRMLGVHPWSSVANAHAAGQRLRALDPEYVVPGHGQVSDMARVERDTLAYYDFLVEVVGESARNFEALSDVMDAHRERPEFMHLEHYESWHGPNMNRAFLEYESM